MMQKNGCDCLWFAFRTGTTFLYLDATAMARALGDTKCDGLPACHALTGCDVTSSFVGKGKRTAWTAWRCHASSVYTVKNANDIKCHECSSHN